MSTTATIITVVVALWVGFSAAANALHARWVVASLTAYGVPRSWWPWLSAAKAAGAVGLVVGLFVPVVGVLAGVGLVLYFIGAVVTVLRAGFVRHLPGPLLYLVPVGAALALRIGA